MLTRIEIDGFKSFDHFALDFEPFMVLLGQNAAGKSNLFDALRFLSATATRDLPGATNDVRGGARGLFRQYANGKVAGTISFAAELLLPARFRAPSGEELEQSQTLVRYEVQVGVRTLANGLERLVVLSERLGPTRPRNGTWATRLSAAQSRQWLKYRPGTPWLSTGGLADEPVFTVLEAGREPLRFGPAAHEATALSRVTIGDSKHLFAVREELRSWRFLQLDPAALRRPSNVLANETLDPDGSNLPTVLARIRAETKSEDRPDGALGDIAMELGGLIDGFRDFEVEEDKYRNEYRVRIRMRNEPALQAQVASDGTLRLLALWSLLYDPGRIGLVCVEEPENGVHPGGLAQLIGRIREAVRPEDPPESDAPLRVTQLLMNSHSPVVLAALEDGEGVFLDTTTVVTPGGDPPPARRSRVRIVRRLPAGTDNEVTPQEADRYLSHARPQDKEAR
jgi:predicted ATPase